MSTAPAAPTRRSRALLEALRAPLLLSPLADVLAGFCVAAGAAGGRAATATDGRPLALTALTGICLLASGMAQNALADVDEDRLRKPSRPLPRGAVGRGVVAWVMVATGLAGLGLAAAVSRTALGLAALIVVGSAAYHLGLKRHRLAGCALLGAARGLDLSLGAAAWLALAPQGAAMPRIAVAVSVAYGLYVAGASLHASTDDAPGGAAWSRAGIGLSLVVLGTLLAAGISGADAVDAAPLAGAAVLLWAIVRLVSGAQRLPPAALTGVALSNLYLLDAALCLGAGPPRLGAAAGLAVLGLFWFSRRLLRVFPPT